MAAGDVGQAELEVLVEAVPLRLEGATPGEHTIVSRVTDANGLVQPTEKDLENKKSFLEHNAQHARQVMIS